MPSSAAVVPCIVGVAFFELSLGDVVVSEALGVDVFNSTVSRSSIEPEGMSQGSNRGWRGSAESDVGPPDSRLEVDDRSPLVAACWGNEAMTGVQGRNYEAETRVFTASRAI